MKVGDLVKSRGRIGKYRIDEVGIVVEVHHPAAKMPDYRTPTEVLVFYGSSHRDGMCLKHEIWFHKNELEIV